MVPEGLPNIFIKFQALDTGETVGHSLRDPAGITEKQFEELLNQLSGMLTSQFRILSVVMFQVKKTTSDPLQTVDIVDNLYSSLLKSGHKTSEDTVTLVFTPKAVFKVRPVTRSSSTIAGHGSTILCSDFAFHTSARVVTGAGDNISRIWDCDTQTPIAILSDHTNWVRCVSWYPNGDLIATGSMDNTIRLWESQHGKLQGDALGGHHKWITSLAWEPVHF